MAEVLQFCLNPGNSLTVLDENPVFADLDAIGLEAWRQPLAPLLRERLADSAHGDLATWRDVVDALPSADSIDLETADIRDLLLRLAPWRKGPFRMAGVEIDAEWRSNLKWDRLKSDISPLGGRNILDVGSGNGYYALRMREAGASIVIGIDPTLLFVMQFAAIRKLTGIEHVHVLPLRLEDLPAESRAFDTTFSMGVLYHRRDPAAHLRELRETLRAGGELVLETLVLPGDGDLVIEPDGRYARMRNVWHLPTVAKLLTWLDDAGFRDARVVDISVTTCAEQRTTAWMPFESLEAALDPADPSLTIEGLPAPTRAVVICRQP